LQEIILLQLTGIKAVTLVTLVTLVTDTFSYNL